MKFCKKCGEPGPSNFCKKCGGKLEEATTDESGYDAATDKTYGYLSVGFKTRTVDEGLREMLGLEAGVTNITLDMYPKCKECGKPVTKDGIKVGDDFHHKRCYKGDVFCCVCNKPLLGEVICVMDKNYCKNCWACTDCHRKLQDDYVEFKGNPYCKKCADERKERKTREVQPARTTKRTQVSSDDKRKRELDKLANAVTCTACGKPMREVGVMCGDMVYHEDCFVCAHCHKPFPDMSYVLKDGEPYHSDCSKKKFANKCSVCGKPLVSGRMYEFDGKKMHEKCFKCQSCGKALQGSYVEKNGKILCDACGTSAPTVTKTRVGAPGQRKGFRVDPITGRKIFN